jgi:hypothetical protein
MLGTCDPDFAAIDPKSERRGLMQLLDGRRVRVFLVERLST